MAPEGRLAGWRARTDAFLAARLPAESQAPTHLHAAMRYAVLGDGKRLRPLLVYAAAQAVAPLDDDALAGLDHAAAAVELIHAYSLVHDDLPAMDDDALRRGRPTVHVAFDEATAILAGDALQAEAFAVLAAAPVPASRVVPALTLLADAAGSRGMCGGQAIDMAATGRMPDLEALATMHAMKTGALIAASVRLGGWMAGADAPSMATMADLGARIGLAFQIKDDLLDAEADSAALGKTAGKDAAQGKSTYVTLLGLEGARARLAEVASGIDAALARLPGNGDGQALADLAVMAVQRGR